MRFYIIRLGQSLIAMWGVVTIVFVALHLSGNPAQLIAGQSATAQVVHNIEVQLGLNKPLIVQYGLFLGGLLHGDFGFSYAQSQPALWIVAARAPYSIKLALAAVALTIVVGVPTGILLAVRKGQWVDRLLMPVVTAGQSMPTFWSGLLLVLLFAVTLHWFPSSGDSQPTSIVLPAVTLASISIAAVARMTRSTVLAELGKDYVRSARAKGLADRVVLYKHILRNAAIPIITVVVLQLASLMGGAVIAETIFAWPGIGQLTVQSVEALDFPVVETIVILASAIYIASNLVADILYSIVDPRVSVDEISRG